MSVTGVDQLSAGGQYPHEDCGEACVASILIDAGEADSVRDIEWFDATNEDNPADGTGGQVHVERLEAAHIPAHVDGGQPWSAFRAGLMSRGLNRCMVAIWSDHGGNPLPGSGIGHWLLWGGGDAYMNPVGGAVMPWPVAMVEAAVQDGNPYVVVDEYIGGGQHVSITQPVRCGAATVSGKGYAIYDAADGYFPQGDADIGTGSLAGKLAAGTHVVSMAFVAGPAGEVGLIAFCSDGGVQKFGYAATGPAGALGGFHP